MFLLWERRGERREVRHFLHGSDWLGRKLKSFLVFRQTSPTISHLFSFYVSREQENLLGRRKDLCRTQNQTVSKHSHTLLLIVSYHDYTSVKFSSLCLVGSWRLIIIIILCQKQDCWVTVLYVYLLLTSYISISND